MTHRVDLSGLREEVRKAKENKPAYRSNDVEEFLYVVKRDIIHASYGNFNFAHPKLNAQQIRLSKEERIEILDEAKDRIREQGFKVSDSPWLNGIVVKWD